tara:strand:- start:341 stop:502 length:162 start_codon:yes stop_codon:yes gene_type:complete
MLEYKLFSNNYANPAVLAKWVRNNDIQTTLRHYTKAIKETRDRNINLLSIIAS